MMPSWSTMWAVVAGLVITTAVTVWTAQEWRYQARLSSMSAAHALDREKAIAKARQAEQDLRNKMESERAQYENDIRQNEIALAAALDKSSRLRNTIAAERRRAAEAAAAAGADPRAAAAPWLVLEECRAEYVKVAKDADELNARLRLAAGYARTVSSESGR